MQIGTHEYKSVSEVLSPKMISEIQAKYHVKLDMQVCLIQGSDFQIDKLKYD